LEVVRGPEALLGLAFSFVDEEFEFRILRLL
jgi:hypothetical protein